MTIRQFMLAMLIFGASADADAIEQWANGLDLPETISLAPESFAGHGGSFFVPDPGPRNMDGLVPGENSNIWFVPATGGTPQFFAGLEPRLPGFTSGYRGGVFLPPGFGQWEDQYLVTGAVAVTSFDADGSSSIVATPSDFDVDMAFVPVHLTTPVMAPDSFGQLGGHLIVSYFREGHLTFSPDGMGGIQVAVNEDPLSHGGVVSISPAGVAMHLVTPSVLPADPSYEQTRLTHVEGPFGLSFAPDGFGKFGNDLFVSDSQSRNIVTVNPDGDWRLFGRLPESEVGQDGARQMSFSPASFGPLGEQLFVSVAAGNNAPGTIYVFNEKAETVGQLQDDPSVGPIDPRGIKFLGNEELLISDATGRVLKATINDFYRPGDANRDYTFNQADIVLLLQANAYLKNDPANWEMGDFNEDRRFDQRDFVAALSTGTYLTGPYLVSRAGDLAGDIDPHVVPEPSTLGLLCLGLIVLIGSNQRTWLE